MPEVIQAAALAVALSPLVTTPDWESITTLRAESRSRNAEGFMLKRLDSPYGVGRVKGDWWKWKVDPYTVDAVMISKAGQKGPFVGILADRVRGW